MMNRGHRLMNIQLPDSQKSESLNKESYCPPSNLQKLINQVKQFGKLMGEILGGEPKFKIRYHQDGAGNELWQVYDVSRGSTVYLSSEEEVRVWIEEYFYHRHQDSNPGNHFDLYQQRRLF